MEENIIEIYYDGVDFYIYVPASAQVFLLQPMEVEELPEDAKQLASINLSD